MSLFLAFATAPLVAPYFCPDRVHRVGPSIQSLRISWRWYSRNLQANPIKPGSRCEKESLIIRFTECQIRREFGSHNGADVLAIWSHNPDAARPGRVYVTSLIHLYAVWATR